jgi:hypothetical protein
MSLGAPDLAGRIAVFAGPSLPPSVRPNDPRLVWLPPAAAGDAYALIAARPRAVVLIDGLFDAWPAIRHKELLDLIAAGVPVIGGASMGALRAAELHRFGMIGVGRIFVGYAAGRLTGDDEVAVLHGPEALGWAALTEALINVRATLLRATRQRVVTAEAGRAVLLAAQAVFYKDRTWRGLCQALARPPGGAPPARALEAWLPAGRVNLKQADALACVAAALDLGGDQGAPPFSLPRSPFAQALADQVSRGVTRPGRPFSPPR